MNSPISLFRVGLNPLLRERAERKKEKQYFDEWNKKIASQYHASEYADAFPQDKKRGGKVKKKKKKKKKYKSNKIMQGYKAGGKV